MRILETYNFENQTTYGITGEIKTATLFGSNKIAVANDSYIEIFDVEERQSNFCTTNKCNKTAFKCADNVSVCSIAMLDKETHETIEVLSKHTANEESSLKSNKSNSIKSPDENHKSKQIFPTFGEIDEMIFCKKGSYLLTLEKLMSFERNYDGNQLPQIIPFKRKPIVSCKVNADPIAFYKVLVYTNVIEYFRNYEATCKEMPLLVPRIASKITPTVHITNAIEVIELEMDDPPDMIDCCQETGNIIVKSNFHLYFFNYRECLNETQHFSYIDFFEFPFTLELNFLPTQISLIENVVACMNQKQCIVFKIMTREHNSKSHVFLKNQCSTQNDAKMDCSESDDKDDDEDEDDDEDCNGFSFSTNESTTTTTEYSNGATMSKISNHKNDEAITSHRSNIERNNKNDIRIGRVEKKFSDGIETKHFSYVEEANDFRIKTNIHTDSFENSNANNISLNGKHLRIKSKQTRSVFDYETLIRNEKLTDCNLTSTKDNASLWTTYRNKATNNGLNSHDSFFQYSGMGGKQQQDDGVNTSNSRSLNSDIKILTIEDHPIRSNNLNVKLLHEKRYTFSNCDDTNATTNRNYYETCDRKYQIKKMLQIRMASFKYANNVKIAETFTCFDLKAIYKKSLSVNSANLPSNSVYKSQNTKSKTANSLSCMTNLMRSERYNNCIGFNFIITTTASDGYLYQFCNHGKWYRENQKPLTKYQFTAPVISIIISDFVVHAVTRETVETVTSRIGHKLFSSYYEYPMLSNPFPNESAATTDMQIFCMKLHSFCNIQFVLKTEQFLILISKCPVECSSSISSFQVSNSNSSSFSTINDSSTTIATATGLAPRITIDAKQQQEKKGECVNELEYSTIPQSNLSASVQNNSNENTASSTNFGNISSNTSSSGGCKNGANSGGVAGILNGKYFQFNSINKLSLRKPSKSLKLQRQNSFEWTVYNLKMPDALRLADDLESSARETLSNGSSIFVKGNNETSSLTASVAANERHDAPELMKNLEMLNRDNMDKLNLNQTCDNLNDLHVIMNATNSLSTTTATYDLVYELLTEANIILRLAKYLDYNYNESYLEKIDTMFKRNCKFLADVIIQLDKEEQYSEAVGYYRMSETSPQTIYETFFKNMRIQVDTTIDSSNHRNKMIGLTHAMKTILNCFAKKLPESKFLNEPVAPILQEYVAKQSHNNDQMIQLNKITDNCDEFTSPLLFGHELFRFFYLYEPNLLSIFGLKSMPFLDCNINNYTTYLNSATIRRHSNEMLLHALTLSRTKNYEKAILELENMDRHNLFVSLKFSWEIMFDDNFNVDREGTKDENFSEFTERVLFRITKVQLIEAIADVYLYYLCITNKITITFVTNLFLNYFSLNVEDSSKAVKYKDANAMTNESKCVSIGSNCIARKIFEIILGGFCDDFLTSQILPIISQNADVVNSANNNNVKQTSNKQPFHCNNEETNTNMRMSQLNCSPEHNSVDFDLNGIKNSSSNSAHPKINISNPTRNNVTETQMEFCSSFSVEGILSDMHLNNRTCLYDVISKGMMHATTIQNDNMPVKSNTNKQYLKYQNNMFNEEQSETRAMVLLLRLYLGNLAIATKQLYKQQTENQIDLTNADELMMNPNSEDEMVLIRMQYINELICLYESNKLFEVKCSKRITFNQNQHYNIINNNNINGNSEFKTTNNRDINKYHFTSLSFDNDFESQAYKLPNYNSIHHYMNSRIPNDKVFEFNNKLQRMKSQLIDDHIRPIACLNERSNYLNGMEPFKKNLHFHNNYFVGHSDEIIMWVLKIQCLLSSLKTNCILYDFILFIQKNPTLIGIDSFISILLPVDLCVNFLIIMCPEVLYDFGKCYKISNDDFRLIFRTLISKIRAVQNVDSISHKQKIQIERYNKVLDGMLDSLHTDRSFESFLNCLPIEEVSILGNFVLRTKSNLLRKTKTIQNNNKKYFQKHLAEPERSTEAAAASRSIIIESEKSNIAAVRVTEYVMDNIDETNIFQIFLRKCVAKQRVEALQAMIESTGKQLFEAAKNSQLNLS